MGKTRKKNVVESAAALNFNEAVKFAVACLRAGRTPYLQGQPGIGKTSTAPHIVNELGLEGYVIITPTMHNALDLRGFGYVKYLLNEDGTPVKTAEGREMAETRFAQSTVLPHSGKWLVFIDELPDCPRHEQSGFYQLLLEGRIGEYKIPEGSHVMAAGNRPEDAAAANALSTAILGRVCLGAVIPDEKAILAHAANKGWHPLVISFIRNNPDCLLGFDPADAVGGCTPRDLDAVSRLENDGWTDNPKVSLALAYGNLGGNFGPKYNAHRRIQIPDVDIVLKSPNKAKIDYDKPVMYAYLAAIAQRADEKTIKNIVKYHDRLKAAGQNVMAMCLMIDCVNHDSSLVDNPDFADWYLNNAKF